MLYRYENRTHNKATNQISNRSAVDAGKSDTEIYVGHTDFSSHISPILLNRMTLYLVSSSAVMTCNVCALFGSVRLRVEYA
jgi:hypothetical protein